VTAGAITYLCLQPMRQGQASYAHVTEIVAGLRRLGWTVHLVTVPSDPGDGLVRRLRSALAAQLRWRAQQLDVVYVRTHPAALPVVVWARLHGTPVVQELNGSPGDVTAAWPLLRPLQALIAASFRWQLRHAAAVITVTDGLRRWVQEQAGAERVSVVPNGADPDRFTPDTVAPPVVAGRYVTFFGALAPWQGIGTLLAASARPEWPEGVAVVIAGDGAQRAAVEAAARRDPGRVVYLGTLDYDVVPVLVARSLAALIPKEYAAAEVGLSPLKLYEAMASGVPVVVSDLPELGETVRNEQCGLVFDVGDAAGLASAVRALADDPSSASLMGARGRKAVLERHSWSRRAADTAAVLADVLARRGTRRSTPGG
jgi:glycosyltransferase involved in cell wall biosynthesis